MGPLAFSSPARTGFAGHYVTGSVVLLNSLLLVLFFERGRGGGPGAWQGGEGPPRVGNSLGMFTTPELGCQILSRRANCASWPLISFLCYCRVSAAYRPLGQFSGCLSREQQGDNYVMAFA